MLGYNYNSYNCVNDSIHEHMYSLSVLLVGMITVFVILTNNKYNNWLFCFIK